MKRLFISILTLLLAFSLCACGSTEIRSSDHSASHSDVKPVPSEDDKTDYSYVMEDYSPDAAEVLYDAADPDLAFMHETIEPDGDTIKKLVQTPDGYIAETEFAGWMDNIIMLVGLDNDLRCTGIYVVKHRETSGHGAEAAEIDAGAWRDNLLGQGDGLQLEADGGEVEAISGATITSKAIVTEVQTVIDAVQAIR